jgi:hypothetical protein
LGNVNIDNIDGVRIWKFIYDLRYVDLTQYMDEVLTIKDSITIVNLLGNVPSQGSPDKYVHNWDMVLLDEESRDTIELILYKNDIGFTLVDMTKEYHKESSSITDKFTKDVDEYIKDNLDLDEVLDRIHKVGVENITIFERVFLDGFKSGENK